MTNPRALTDEELLVEVERLRLALRAIRFGRQTEHWRRRAAEIEDQLLEVEAVLHDERHL